MVGSLTAPDGAIHLSVFIDFHIDMEVVVESEELQPFPAKIWQSYSAKPHTAHSVDVVGHQHIIGAWGQGHPDRFPHQHAGHQTWSERRTGAAHLFLRKLGKTRAK